MVSSTRPPMVFLAAMILLLSSFIAVVDGQGLFDYQLPRQQQQITKPQIFPFPFEPQQDDVTGGAGTSKKQTGIVNENTIVNGENANADEFPWYAVFSGGVLCGGGLVEEDIIVTAAHCIDGDAPPAVRIGGTNSGNGELIDVIDSVIHPNYRANTLENDIAILVLASPSSAPVADYNRDASEPRGGDAVIAMGYGRTDPQSGGGSSTLQRLDMEAVNDEACEDRYSDHQPDFNLCVDNNRGGICFGDSGSPVTDPFGLILGVASFIIQTCNSQFPDFYTRMSSYSTWLERTICEESANPANQNCENVGDDDGPDQGGDEDCFFDIIFDCIGTLFDIIGGR